MIDIRFCLLYGTVCFIAGNSLAAGYWRRLWHYVAVVFWLLALSIGTSD